MSEKEVDEVIPKKSDMTHRQYTKLKVYKILVDSIFEQTLLSPGEGLSKDDYLSIALDVLSPQLVGLDWEWVAHDEEEEGGNLTWLVNCAFSTVQLMLEELLKDN